MGRFRDFEYRFPYPDGSFDLVFAVSVFTHLLPEGTERYIAEASRVLRPGGHFLATYFLLNQASTEALEAGKSTITFKHRFPVYRTYKRRIPESAVAYDEEFVTGLYPRYGLTQKQRPAYGFWSGRPRTEYGGYQDLLVATRAPRS